jgi:hypothetical protein
MWRGHLMHWVLALPARMIPYVSPVILLPLRCCLQLLCFAFAVGRSWSFGHTRPKWFWRCSEWAVRSQTLVGTKRNFRPISIWHWRVSAREGSLVMLRWFYSMAFET